MPFINSDFEPIEIEQLPSGFAPPVKTRVDGTAAYDVIPPVGSTNGIRMLKVLRYNFELMAVAIYARKNYREILNSIESP